jgi:DNA-binding beta-propeller fold protein YncE
MVKSSKDEEQPWAGVPVGYQASRTTEALLSDDSAEAVQASELLGSGRAGHRDGITALALAPDGRTVATGGSDSGIFLWDARTGRSLGPRLTGHRSWLSSLAFSPDGKLLASGSYDNTVILWDTRSRRPIGEPLAVGDDVLDVAFSPDGRMLAALAWDRILLWDTRGWQALGQPLAGRPGGQLAFRPDGKVLASAGTSGVILWDTDLASWKALACARASRNLSRAEWDQFIGTLAPYQRTCPQFPDGRPPPAGS